MRRITKEEAYFVLKGKFVRSKDEEDNNKHIQSSLTKNNQVTTEIIYSKESHYF
jgi:hypothetical protein